MFIYLFSIIVLFITSYTRYNPKTEKVLFVLLAIFLCFGYMCGSDWRNYESEFYSNFSHRAVEPGYMFISNLLVNNGVGFWVFHTITKVLCWCSFLHIFKLLWPERNLGFPLMLFMASFGFFLFIDCPFRNLISVAIFLLFIPCLEKKKYLLYIIGVLLASSFHLSAFCFVVLPFLNINKFSNKILLLLYFTVFIVLLSGLDQVLVNFVLSPFPFLHSKVLAYEDSELIQGGVISIGLILRLICLFGMLYFRDRLYAEGKHFIFSMCYIYLILSLFSYSMPILFRVPLFLSPFFVLMEAEIINYFLNDRTRTVLKFFYLMVALTITIRTASSVYLVPYTNVIPYWIKGRYPSYVQRSNYNFEHSPYRFK